MSDYLYTAKMDGVSFVFVWSVDGLGGTAIISRHNLGPQMSVDSRRLSSFVPR